MANVLLSFLVCIASTVLFVGIGIYMLVSGDATPLHSYHRENVLAQDLAPLARWSGVEATMIGAGMLLLSLLQLTKTDLFLTGRGESSSLSSEEYFCLVVSW